MSTVLSKLFCGCDTSFNFRSNSNFAVLNEKSVFHGSESISFLVWKIWDVVPVELKKFSSQNAFKKGIKNNNQKKLSLQAM